MRAELIELQELKKLLEEHQPILEDREKGLANEVENIMPELESAIKGLTHNFKRATSQAVRVVKRFGPRLYEKAVPLETVSVDREGFVLLESEPAYSVTLTDSSVDLMTKEFRELLKKIVDVVHIQMRVREIADELNDVRRKNNAIKHAIIPDIVERIKRIESDIEQEELEEMVRLKTFSFE